MSTFFIMSIVKNILAILLICVLGLYLLVAVSQTTYLSENPDGKYSYTVVNKQEIVEYSEGSAYTTKYYILFMDSIGNIYKNRVEEKEYKKYKIGHIIKLNNKLQ